MPKHVTTFTAIYNIHAFTVYIYTLQYPSTNAGSHLIAIYLSISYVLWPMVRSSLNTSMKQKFVSKITITPYTCMHLSAPPVV